MLVQGNYRKIRNNQGRKRRLSENSRINIVLSFMFVFVVFVVLNVLRFELSESRKWAMHGNNIYYRHVPIMAERGRILDRNGVIVVMDKPMRNIIVDPYQLINFPVERMKLQGKPRLLERLNKSEQNYHRNLQSLANYLNIPLQKIGELFDPRSYIGKTKGDHYLKRNVDKIIANKIKALNIPGIKIVPIAERSYPDGNLFGEIIGVANRSWDAEKNERIIGLEGLEYQFDHYLRGQAGLRVMIQDNNGRYINMVDSPDNKPVKNGKDLILSLDKNIQAAAMDALKKTVEYHKASSGSAVVLDAKTGEILAMVDYPNFDPAHFNKYSSEVRRNHAIIDVMEPGSLFKPFIVAKALDEGKVNPNTIIDTAPYILQNHKIADVSIYPSLTVTGIIRKSSNVGVSKLMSMLDSQDVYYYLQQLGIGRQLHTEFPGEAKGILHNWRNWSPLDKASISYGYGVQASLLQIAAGYTIFTNDGRLLTPSFLKLQNKAPSSKRIISEKTAKQMRQIMTTVTEKGGTGVLAAIDGYAVAGKSGTARKLVNGHYSSNSHMAMFAGYAPADQPRLIVAVSINNPQENGYYGGSVAAPAFKLIMTSALSILGVMPSMHSKQTAHQ